MRCGPFIESSQICCDRARLEAWICSECYTSRVLLTFYPRQSVAILLRLEDRPSNVPRSHMISLERFPTLGRPCAGTRTFQPQRQARWSRLFRCARPSKVTATSSTAPPCSSFEAEASGEWEGVTATFDSGGQPLELPYHQVPAAFRWTILASLSPLLTDEINCLQNQSS